MENESKKDWMLVNISFKKGQNQKQIYELEKQLLEKNISFDTGTMVGEYRDWELDWSLKGAKPQEILNFLDANNVEYKLVKS